MLRGPLDTDLFGLRFENVLCPSHEVQGRTAVDMFNERNDDRAEAEHELVAGYHSEYSGMKFGMFFVGEYIGITLISAMIVTLFFGGWLGPVLPPIVWIVLKTMFFICFFILLRAAMPRPRFDQLMSWGWKWMLPLSLANLAVTGAVVLAMRR